MADAAPTIRITYMPKRGGSPGSVELAARDYYDSLAPGETYERDGIPRFDHAYRYTPCSPEELLWTVLDVNFLRGGAERTVIRTQFLDGSRSMMTHRADADGYEEIIHSTQVDPGRWHHLRTVREPGRPWAVTLNSLTDERPGAKVASRDFCGDWSPETIRRFSSVAGPDEAAGLGISR
jgi:hypothetical protein